MYSSAFAMLPAECRGPSLRSGWQSFDDNAL